MGKIIDSKNLEKHNVKKFTFGTIETDKEKTSFTEELFTQETTKEPEEEASVQENEPLDSNNKAEDFLSKIETLSSENITLTLQLEELQKEFDEKLNSQREEAFKTGKEEGMKEAQASFQEHNDQLNIQLVKSITTLDEQVHALKNFLTTIEEELVSASIIIAKKIIKKELNENSQEVAKTLAMSFLADLKEASTITLKVNPEDAKHLEEHFSKEKNIMIASDDAINKGGIIILSDIGNIDGNIQTRMEKAIALIEREG